MTVLQVRYERLLFAYPREYRRRRGAEIAATFTEMAAEGQRWPRGRDAASLLFHGLRTRLGRPRSRLVVPVAVMAMLVGGLCAAAGGARLGWGQSTALSSRQLSEVDQLGPVSVDRQSWATDLRVRMPAWFADYLSMPAARTPMILVTRGDTTMAMYMFSPVVPVAGVAVTAQPDPAAREQVDRERARLAGTGWKVTNVVFTENETMMAVRHGDLVGQLLMCPRQAGSVAYTRASETGKWSGLDLGDNGNSGTGPDGFGATVYRTTPATVPVFAVLAGLLGATMMYLLVGWLSRRTGALAATYRRVAAAGVASAVLLAVPAAVVCGAGIWTALFDHTDSPIRYWGGFATGEARTGALAASILLVVALAGVRLVRPATEEAQ